MNAYLEKHGFCERQLDAPVAADTNIIVIIPCYNEPDILRTLKSLFDCDSTNCIVEIIVVINSGEQDDENMLKQNTKTFLEATAWIKDLTSGPSPRGEGRNKTEPRISFHVIQIKNLPKKHAGVGLARKIGMDEAVARFDEISNQEGIIVCLDADCTVDENYLVEIENYFERNPKSTGCSIYFEHPVEGNEFEQKIYDGIINYELFLRYYKCALHYCNFPYAYHTIGSCMAVRNKIYQKQGGMNRRKAGEDFYFLHKILSLGSFGELNSTKVIPSPRESNRVPFGTGSAIKKMLQSPLPPPKGDFLPHKFNEYFTYNLQTLVDLKIFFKLIPDLFSSSNYQIIKSSNSLPPSIQSFLSANHFEKKLQELKQHSSSEKAFVKRFFNWFDGFMVLKFVHFARDNFYKQQEIFDAVNDLVKLYGNNFSKNISKKEMLIKLRQWERNSDLNYNLQKVM